MAIIVDPENNETRTLFDMVKFDGQQVLEIGCGDGRLTWRYAHMAEHVTATDPSAKQIALARKQLADPLRDRVDFQCIAFEDFAKASAPSAFDIAILSWSLC